jgi:hypothetical protein
MRHVRTISGLLGVMILAGVLGCSPTTVSGQSRVPEPAPPARQPTLPGQGMSTRNKVLLLAGAAALYYLYKKHQNRQGEGIQGQYYRSKNGGIYYRDPKNPRIVHWVSPPTAQKPLRVPVEEYERYTGRQMDNYSGQVLTNAPQEWR